MYQPEEVFANTLGRTDTGAVGYSALSAPKGIEGLRDRRRILHHLPLIREKLEIGERLGLASVDGRRPVAIEILDAFANQHLSLPAALKELKSFAGYNGAVEQIAAELGKCYRTGLLEFHITDVCDLDCIECHYRAKNLDTLPFNDIPRLITALAPKAITITGGGEPNVYLSQGKTLADVVNELRRLVPSVELGLINNNSHIPPGNWTSGIAWQRTSLDSATPQTFFHLKRRDLFEKIVSNVKKLLLESTIPDVGVGFLFRSENAVELHAFLRQWHEWLRQEPPTIQRRFNIQFRPISPAIEDMGMIREGDVFPDRATQVVLSEQASAVRAQMRADFEFDTFVRLRTNFVSIFGDSDKSYDTSLFTHPATEFSNCYNALAHRVLRATGKEYPDFLLCNQPELALGNPLKGGTEEILRVALMQFYFFNRLSHFCSGPFCRQGWVSRVIEDNGGPKAATPPGITDSFFF